MLLLLILPVLVAGFFACHIHPFYRYKLHRYEGQYLYLKSAELGLVSFILAFIISIAFYHWFPSEISIRSWDIKTSIVERLIVELSMMGVSEEEVLKLSWFFILSGMTFLSGFLIVLLAYLRFCIWYKTWTPKVYVIGKLLADSPLDNLLFSLSLQKDKHVMLTMSDRKVYVGKIINLGEPTATDGMDQDISIMPVMSGFRDKDTLKVTFTTFYQDAGADIYLSLRQEAIISATEFSFEAYEKWNPPALINDNNV